MRALAEISRVALGRLIEGVFDNGPASRDGLIERARANGADPEELAVLERLRGPSYRELRELWRELPELPVLQRQPISNA